MFKKWTIPAAAVILFWTGAGMAHAANPYPNNVALTQVTDLYEAPMADLPPVMQLAPQEVYITGFQPGDDRSHWYRIATWRGEKWVRLGEEAFRGQEQEAAYDAILLEDTPLYDEPRRDKGLGISIAPQTVHVKAISGSYLRIGTWLGDKWIRLSEKILPDAVVEERMLDLKAVTPVFAKPDSASERLMELAPQQVVSFEQVNGWHHIRTATGAAWLHPQISLPRQSEAVQETVRLTQRSLLYAYPSFASKVLGALAPQEVQAVERAGNWLRIRSDWLGEVWVFPIDDPDGYQAPQGEPAAADTKWEYLQLNIGSLGGRDYPLSADIRMDPPYGGESRVGTPITIGMSLTNTSQYPIRLKQPAEFRLDVLRIRNDGEERVWSVKLPAISGEIPANGYYFTEEGLTWNQTDFAGRQVPQGTYAVRIRSDNPVEFTGEQTEGASALNLSRSMSSGQVLLALPSADAMQLQETAKEVFRRYLLSLQLPEVPDQRRIDHFYLHYVVIEEETPDEFTFNVVYDVAPATNSYLAESGVWSGENWVNSQRSLVRVSRDSPGADGLPKILSVVANPLK